MAHRKLDIMHYSSLPFLLSFNRVLCSRCGQSCSNFATENGKNELKLFLRGDFFSNIFREVEESGRPRLFWKQEFAGSNPAFPTNFNK